MMPYRQMHMNGSVFGDDAGKFVAERFIKNPGLRKFNMAFGGGATMCPGRHLATQTVLVFVAMLLHKFDVELENPRQQFPVAEEAVPVLGIIGVKSAHDIRVNLKVKKISAH
jgi:cytochrome P450